MSTQDCWPGPAGAGLGSPETRSADCWGSGSGQSPTPCWDACAAERWRGAGEAPAPRGIAVQPQLLLPRPRAPSPSLPGVPDAHRSACLPRTPRAQRGGRGSWALLVGSPELFPAQGLWGPDAVPPGNAGLEAGSLPTAWTPVGGGGPCALVQGAPGFPLGFPLASQVLISVLVSLETSDWSTACVPVPRGVPALQPPCGFPPHPPRAPASAFVKLCVQDTPDPDPGQGRVPRALPLETSESQ